jgi:hypothetical protein
MLANSEKNEKIRQVPGGQITRVPLPMENNEAPDTKNASLLSALAVMPYAQRIADRIQRAGPRQGRILHSLAILVTPPTGGQTAGPSTAQNLIELEDSVVSRDCNSPLNSITKRVGSL